MNKIKKSYPKIIGLVGGVSAVCLVSASLLLESSNVGAGVNCNPWCNVDRFTVSEFYWHWNNPDGFAPGVGDITLFTVPDDHRLEIRTWRNTNEAQPFQQPPGATLLERDSGGVISQRLGPRHFNEPTSDRHGLIQTEVGGITFDEGSEVILRSTLQLDYNNVIVAGVLKPKSDSAYFPPEPAEVVRFIENSEIGWSWTHDPNDQTQTPTLTVAEPRQTIVVVPTDKALVFTVRSTNPIGFNIIEVKLDNSEVHLLDSLFTFQTVDIDLAGSVLKRPDAIRVAPGSTLVIERTTGDVSLENVLFVGEFIDETTSS